MKTKYIYAGAADVGDVDRGTVCLIRCLICSYYLISEMKYDIGGVNGVPSSTIKVLFMTKPETIWQPHLIFVLGTQTQAYLFITRTVALSMRFVPGTHQKIHELNSQSHTHSEAGQLGKKASAR